MDLLPAAKRVGSLGRAIGVDMTPQMRETSLNSAQAIWLRHVKVRTGDAEALAVDDASQEDIALEFTVRGVNLFVRRPV